MRITLVNDTRVETNPGCHATVTGLLQLLQATTGADVVTVPLGAGHDRFAPMVASGHARSAAHWHEAVAQLAGDCALRAAVADADLVVVNLEGTFHHHTIGALALGGVMALAHRRGVPVWAVNGTVEDIDLWLLQETLAKVSHLAVREPVSAAWLRARGLRASLAADCAVLTNIFAAPLAFSMPARAALYTPGVLARPDQDRRMSGDVVAGHLAELARAGYAPIYLQMEEAEAPIAERVRAGGGYVLRAIDVPWPAYGTLLQHCDLVVSGRYHVLIFAAMAGVPALALPSNTWKVEGLLAHVGAPQLLIGQSDAMGDALASRRAATPDHATIARMRTLALRNVAGHPAARPSISRASRIPVVIGPSPDADPDATGPVRAHVPWPFVPADLPPAAQLRTAFESIQRRSVASITVAGIETCLPEQVPEVLIALRDAMGATLQVVIDPTPGREWKSVHRTVRPLAVWRRVLALAGLEIAAERAIGNATTAANSAESMTSHWMSLRPFRDHGDQGRGLFLLRRSVVQSADRGRAAMMAALGQRAPVALPSELAEGTVRPVFLVGTYQEFRQYLPLWCQLPPSAFTVLVRQEPGVDGPRRLPLVEDWLRSRGVQVQVVRSVRDIAWPVAQPGGQRAVLVTGAESTAYDSHLWNSAVVSAFRTHGIQTVQMQHGIWPYADLERPMAWLSDRVLVWSREFEGACRQAVTWSDGTTGPRAVLGDVMFSTVGCPVFDTYADRETQRLEDLLGDWVTRYRHRVLVATNLHWTQHHAGASVTPAVLALAARKPDTLFVIKPHPVHDVDAGLVASCPANVVVLDELCCLAAGLDSPRLIRACDAVIATQSTMALEAALAAKPFVIVDSGNPNRYEHVTVVAPDRLGAALDAVFDGSVECPRAFVDYYFDRSNLGTATEAVLGAICEVAEARVESTSLRREDVALSRFSEYLSAYAADVVGLRASLTEARAAVGRVEAECRLLHAQLASARTDDTADRADLEAAVARLAGRCEELEHQAAAHAANLLGRRQGHRLKVVLFGASTGGRRTLEAARQVPHLEVIGFADNDRARWASRVDGVPVFEPDPRWLRTADVIVITSIHRGPIAAQVAAAGCADRLVLDGGVLEQMALRSRTA